jgi:peroxiredoxin
MNPTRSISRVAAVLLPLVAVVLVLGAANLRRADADNRAVGRLYPDVEVIETWNAPPTGLSSLRDLRGRMVVLEWFRVDCPHCQAATVRLGAIQRERFEVGVRVVGICRQSSAELAQFVRNFGVVYPVIRSTVEALEESGLPMYPVAFVLGADGRVLWSGAPDTLDDATLDRLVVEARPWPTLGAAQKPAARALREGDVAVARSLLEPCARDPKTCGDAAAKAAQAILTWIDAWAARLEEIGAAEAARGEPYEAFLAWDQLAQAFGKTPPGVAGTQRIATLLANPASRREVEAGKALHAARWRVAASDGATAAAAFDEVAAANAGTRIATLAREAAARSRR